MEMQAKEDEEDASPSSYMMMACIVRANDPTVAGNANLTTSNLQATIKGKKKKKSEVADRRRPMHAPHLNKVTCDYQTTSKRFRIKNGRNSEAYKLAMKKAKELRGNLSTEHPSFIKQILRSHAISCFMLIVPLEFRSHLPTHSTDVTLEDESGEIYMVRYLTGRKGRFIGGWKRFSVAHKLLQGDVVVFHLLRPCYFKVYIRRANYPNIAGSAKITNLDVRANKGKKKRKCDDRNGPMLASHLDKVQESVGVAYGNQQTIKRCVTKRGGIYSKAGALALERAKDLKTTLSSEHPSFIKQIHRSNVGSYELAVPTKFCRHHLPKDDADVTLEDENGESCIVKFLPHNLLRFRAGWRTFLTRHNLLQGDVVVFHLLRPCYFKVYIIRANDPTIAGNSYKGKKRKHEVADRNSPRLAPYQDTVQEGAERSHFLSNPDPDPDPDPDHQPSKEDPNSSDMEASTLSGQVADFEKFKIIVNNEVIDPELSRSIRLKYYNLCCSQKSYLHNQLLKNVDRTMAAGVIAGTVKVAETIRYCKLYASDDDFAMWDNTLEGLKRFGMEVGFLCDRLKQLLRLASEFRATEEVKKYMEARKKLVCVEEKMMTTEMEFLEWKQSINKLEDEMKTMKVNIDKCRDTFLEEAITPWYRACNGHC